MTQSFFQRLFSLEGKTALVTGASGGIGGALAMALAEAGAVVGVHGRDKDRVDETCAEIGALGGKAIPLLADLAHVQACRDLIGQIVSESGRLDILVNNAGANRRKPIEQVTDDDFEWLTAVNMRSVYVLSQTAHPIMRAQGGGKIIHVASMTAFYGLDTVSVYGLNKGAVLQMTKTMAVEWVKDNIQVNCLTPGFIYTPLTEGVWADDHKAAWLRKRIPMGRPGQSEEMVGAVLLLASPASSYITGQNIIVDGGFIAGGSWYGEA